MHTNFIPRSTLEQIAAAAEACLTRPAKSNTPAQQVHLIIIIIIIIIIITRGRPHII